MIYAACGCAIQDPKAKTLEHCGTDRDVNASLNPLETQDETLRFGVDRSVYVAVI